MIFKYNRIIAYICPYCSELNNREFNIFEFSGGKTISLSCSKKKCGEECVIIRPVKNKYTIALECPVCGETHKFTVSENALWNRSIITFCCPSSSSTEILFIGKRQPVLNKLKNIEMEDVIDTFDDFTEYSNLMYRVIERIDMLLRTEGIHCMCGNSDIIPTISDNGIILECGKCKAKMLIEITQESLDKLIRINNLCLGQTKKPSQ